MPYYPPSQAPPPNLILSSAFISDSYQVSVWTQLGAVISTLPPPSMRNITLNLLFLHWQKYQEVSLNDSNMPALPVCQKDSSAPCKWLLERHCFEVTICSTHSTWAGSVFTGPVSWQDLFVPSEEFICEEWMRMHLGNGLILQKMILVVYLAVSFSSEGNAAKPL